MASYQTVALLIGLAVAAPPAADPVEGLREALKTPGSEPELRNRNLSEAASRLRSVPDLGRALMLKEWRDGDLDPQVSVVDRRQRETLIGRFQGAVRDVFDHGSPVRQSAAAEMVGEVGASGPCNELGRCLAPDLARLATHGNPTVRESATRALGRVAPEPAVALPLLRDLLTTGSAPLRRAAADAVFNSVEVTALRTAPGKGATAKDLVSVACAYLPLTAVGMQDNDLTIRRTCLTTLGRAVAVLVALNVCGEPGKSASTLSDADLLPLRTVLRNLGPSLVRILDDPDATLRLMVRQIIEGIGRLRVRSIPPGHEAEDPVRAMLQMMLPTLALGLSDPDCRLRRATLGALETLGPEAAPAAAALYDALEDTDRFVRWGAARLVGQIGPAAVPGAVPALVRLLHDSDLDLRLTAVATLEQYGPLAAPAVPRLSAMIAGPEAPAVRIGALRTLAAIGKGNAPAVVPVLLASLADPSETIRRMAVQALGWIGPGAQSAADALKKLRDDPSAEVRQAAEMALPQVLVKKPH